MRNVRQTADRQLGEGTERSMYSNFRADTHTTGRAVTVTLDGELDLLSSPILERAFERLAASDAEMIMVDLRGLEFMDSTGLHVLVPWRSALTTLPNHPPAYTSAIARANTMVAEMPRSGATPACDALPWMSTVHRSAPIAPTITSAALRPSMLNPMAGPPRSAGLTCLAP